MGANQSAVYASNEANDSFMTKKSASNGADGSFMPNKTGQVLIFRSSSKWKSHFQSSKETNKLVSYRANPVLYFMICYLSESDKNILFFMFFCRWLFISQLHGVGLVAPWNL